MRIGIDLGGTKIEAVAMDDRGDVVARERVATRREEGYDAIVDRVAGLVDLIEKRIRTEATIGVGHPGSESKSDGTLKNSNTTCMNGQPFRRDLESRLGRPIRMANDANCFALSEAIDGAGAGERVVFGVILGTGVGGGVVIDGKLHSGRNDVGGEWGHTPFDPTGRECYCGKRGCTEQYVSGPALERAYLDVTGTSATGAEIASLSMTHSEARRVLDQYFDDLARALANVINVLDPDVVVLGGGVSAIEALYTALPLRMADAIFNDACCTPIRRNSHGDSSGVRGAAFLWPTPASL